MAKRLEPYKTIKPLKKMMIDREIEWDELAKKTKLKWRAYFLYRGDIPTDNELKRLCEFFECTEDDIIGWEV